MDYSGNLSTTLLSESAMDQIDGAGKAVFSDQMKPDSFTVDMERFTHLTNKDATPNPRINLQRSLSRKGSQRWGEKKMNQQLPIPNADNDRDNAIVSTSSPRAALAGVATPEKPMVVNVGTADQTGNPQQVHHQITMVTGHVPAATTVTTTTTNAATTERRLGGKRFSFRRTSSSSWIDPRRILFFFATLSSMGTILLIYFTLSMNKLSADDSMLN